MRSGLLPEARHVVLPEGIMATGFPAVEATCRQIGIEFDPWQRDLNRAILAKSSSGDYAADTVLMSICRQAGKTYDIGGLVFADSIINPGTTTVWTAHQFTVARESFNELRAWAQSPLLAPHIDYDDITTAAGNECIPFRNGSRILFKARERGAIRGFTKVRRIVLDEGQILTESAMADMAPTMNQAENPQVVLMGTPPKPKDPAEVFLQLRSEALLGESEGLLFVEFSADADSDPSDREQWRKANPSYPKRTKTKAILRLKKLLTEDDFRREGLGIWDSDGVEHVMDLDQWAGLQLNDKVRPDPVVFAVEVSDDRQWGSILLAGQRPDGRRWVQLVESGKGTGWLPERVADLKEKWSPLAVALNPSGPAASMIPALSGLGIEPVLVTGRDYAAACGLFLDAATAPPPEGDELDTRLAHPGQAVMSISVELAAKRKTGTTWVWHPRRDGMDIAPLRGVTVALFVLAREVAKPPENKRGGAVVGVR